MSFRKFTVSAALALFFGSSGAWAAECSGDWILATENGSTYNGSAIHVSNRIVFLGELEDSAAGATLHLAGITQPGTNQVVFENADRAGQLFAAEIASGCSVIRGYAQSGENQVYFTMTKVVVEPPVASVASELPPQQPVAEAPADPFAPTQATVPQAQTATARTVQPEPEEEKGFFSRLWPFGDDDDDEEEIRREKERVLIHRDRLGKGF